MLGDRVMCWLLMAVVTRLENNSLLSLELGGRKWYHFYVIQKIVFVASWLEIAQQIGLVCSYRLVCNGIDND